MLLSQALLKHELSQQSGTTTPNCDDQEETILETKEEVPETKLQEELISNTEWMDAPVDSEVHLKGLESLVTKPESEKGLTEEEELKKWEEEEIAYQKQQKERFDTQIQRRYGEDEFG
ncbi:MAG: hypothetical protein ACTSUE_26320, partial [Promethearchaeota archaeon]